ncbi:hypothetical protein GYA28_04000 [Candidatus Roizmanbacteria bacterium]|nr:hypothetical protein [Candidatus Roizmanbacteria bacterium]
MKIKNIYILAGGDGSRFWPLKEKESFVFAGVSLLEYQIGFFSKIGEKIYIAVSVDSEGKIKKKLPEWSKKYRISLELVIQNKDLPGQGGAILSAKDAIKGESLILNVNDVFSESLVQVLMEKKARKPELILAGKKMDRYFPGGYFVFKNDRISGIVEKPGENDLPSDYVRLVFDYVDNISKLVEVIDRSDKKSDDTYEKGLNRLLNRSSGKEFIAYDGYWYSLKFPWHVLSMMKHFLEKSESFIDGSVSIAKTALIEGKVRLGKGVKIGDYAKILGPCQIGEGTVIGDYSLIRESQVGSGCLIGGHSEVARSYIGDSVYLHRNYIGDSVLDKEVSFGAGAVTANFRFDGKNVGSVVAGDNKNTQMVKLGAIIGKLTKVGINSSLLPGVKIGQNCQIGPASIIFKDLPDGMFSFQGKTVKNRNIL